MAYVTYTVEEKIKYFTNGIAILEKRIIGLRALIKRLEQQVADGKVQDFTERVTAEIREEKARRKRA